ncbi:ABC-type amino acid transport substrate-binding protein [Bradyrhizobium sp. USDA 3397]
MSKRSKLLSLAVGFALAVGAAHAQEAKTLNVGTIVSYPPLEFKDPQTGQLTGFNHDLLAAMAEKAGIKLNWIEFSCSDLASFALLNTGRVDIYGGLMGDNPTRRAAGVSFLDFMYEPYYLYASGANADKFSNPTALCGKRVANTRSSSVMTAAVDKWSAEKTAPRQAFPRSSNLAPTALPTSS